MGTFSIWHWVIVLVIVMLLFGAKRIPELAKGLGSGIKNFKNAIKEDEEQKPTTATTDAKPVESATNPASTTTQSSTTPNPADAKKA